MKPQSAANMHANRRKLLITDKTRLSFNKAMLRMQRLNAREKCARAGHVWGVAACVKCGEPNPAAIILVTDSGIEAEAA